MASNPPMPMQGAQCLESLAEVVDTSGISPIEAAEILARVGWYPGWSTAQWRALSDDVMIIAASAIAVIATATDEEAGQAWLLMQDEWGTA